ncbi:MAG: hypothetical protein H6733_13025 [Alphaproteobacteria bacterium]|nr:hypothetical protein [Alphaproteobacteria bacterium]
MACVVVAAATVETACAQDGDPPETPADTQGEGQDQAPPANPIGVPDDSAVVEATAPRQRPYRVGGIVVPLFDYNSIDGAALGLGVVLYDRLRTLDDGYRNRVSAWTFWTTSGNYSSNYIEYEHLATNYLFARVAYRSWKDMIYVGSGGDDVSVRVPEERAKGNVVQGPTAMVTYNIKIPRTPLYVWVQGFLRYRHTAANAGSLLASRDPYGLGNNVYFDTSFGVFLQEVDRWPEPRKGVRFEASARFGGSAGERSFQPLAGVNTELMGWWPVAGKWLTIGSRAVFDKTWGNRPWWEQEWLGGVLRDELGDEQVLTGYQRSRTRGDGVLAEMIEVRPFLGRTRDPFFDIGFYLSGVAEIAWLFEGDDPGPPMPTVGVGATLLWQGAITLRPFIHWGWLSDVPGGPRTPSSTINIAVQGPL